MMTNDPLPPWFSGLGLSGGCASQYELDQGSDGGETTSALPPSPMPQPAEPNMLRLEGLAPITIFVGANNSGKSRLMRELFIRGGFDCIKLSVTKDGSSCEANPIIEQVVLYALSYPDGSFRNGENWLFTESEKPGCLSLAKANEILTDFDSYPRPAYQKSERHNQIKAELIELGLDGGIRNTTTIQRWYVPILRGMRPPLIPDQGSSAVMQRSEDLYELRTKHDYFSRHPQAPQTWDVEQVCRVFTGLSLFADLRRRLLGRTQDERDSVREYEAFLADNFFAGSPVTLVPVEEDGNDVVHIKIADKDDYPIYQLGDGLQSLIICTYPIVTELKPGSLFFLEEPDLGMHPSLQRSFVRVLKDYHQKMGHQFFLTTHSNHLLDLLEDDQLVSIFSFSEKETPDRFRIRRALPRDREVLMQLGVRPSATYLANATIWVEGPSDCAYLRAYMEAFIDYLKTHGSEFGKRLANRLQAYKEDRHYAFVEYSGANLVHFNFAETTDSSRNTGESDKGIATTHVPSLCAQSIVIADGDTASKGNRVQNMTSILGERFVLLPGKEIENLIPEVLVRLLVKDDLRSQEFDDATMDKILGTINYSSYARKVLNNKPLGLGRYLDSLIGKILGKGKVFTGYVGEGNSGTLKPSAKQKWAKQIPQLMEQKRQERHKNEEQEELANDAPPEIPSWLNQDIVWLMMLIYSHVSRANHDNVALQYLDKWKQWITGQCDDGEVWPIPDPAHEPDRSMRCLLTDFLRE
ncbi:MAG: hypothetical protein RLZZ609_2468 [Cyanobacteriota bacterium]|jgi:hypothetical protein